MNRNLAIFCLFLILSCGAVSTGAQTKSKRSVKKTVKKPAAVKTAPVAALEPEVPASAKKNERPSDTPAPTEGKKTNRPAADTKATLKPVYPYFYEFTQPAFTVNRLTIEHDEAGKGIVTFTKNDNDEAYTDPIQLSVLTMQKLKGWWDALNFLDSIENYQSEKQFAHLGTMKLRLKRDKRERLAQFNWTENKDAKALADEYRNLGQQFVWVFDITVSRENRPLDSPKLMETLDSMLRRKEISDPQQMLPFLTDLSEDERIPLMARNHASRLIKQIEKEKK